jgi:hypothetical protein
MQPANTPAFPTRDGLRFWSLSLLIAALAAYLYATVGVWPFGMQPDEGKKAYFVLSGGQDFLHPILMVQIGRLANAFAGFTDVKEFMPLARDLSAVFGGLLVLSTFVLGRVARLSPWTALAVSVAVAASPLVAVHATFFKEDIFLAPLFVASVVALIMATDRPNGSRSLALGIAIGLAVSTKYIGAVLLPVSVIAILIVADGSWRERLIAAAIATGAAFATFAIINGPLFFDLSIFEKGLAYETTHVLTGHFGMAPGPGGTFGVMHLTDSLAPGLGLPLLVIGLAGLTVPFIDRDRRRPLAIILAVALTWYWIHEITPMKPYGIERYMVPIVPLFLVLGAALLEKIFDSKLPKRAKLLAPIVLLVASLPTMYSAYALLSFPHSDPRTAISSVAASIGPGIRPHRFTMLEPKTVMAAALGPDGKSGPADTTVFSDLVVDRYMRYGQRATLDQTDRGLMSAVRFVNTAFVERRWPYLVISNGLPSFSYLNQDIYIFALDRNIERLKRIKLGIETASLPNQNLSVEMRGLAN